MKLKLPEYVQECYMCKGTGESAQMFTHGCGGGYYRSQGKCDTCAREGEYSMKGVGYIYKNDERWDNKGVPQTVIQQIVRMNLEETEPDV